ncbi:MAG: hypothetical protein AAGJ46_05905 [Planctomycetota bacterium]
MRLTLRTLLAYMDGVLEPEAQAELEKMIEQNPDANDLIYRTRDTVRRLRLGAPPVDAGADSDEASPFDANTVAEYLDSTASLQSVMDVELNCLRSDMHLAEVGACHQILTMVLGEAAEVDPETRRRMYGIPEVAKLIAANAGQAAAEPAGNAGQSDTRVTEVPDYIREGGRSWVTRWTPAVAALLLLGVVSFMAFRKDGWLRPSPETTEFVVQGGPKADPEPKPADGETAKTESEAEQPPGRTEPDATGDGGNAKEPEGDTAAAADQTPAANISTGDDGPVIADPEAGNGGAPAIGDTGSETGADASVSAPTAESMSNDPGGTAEEPPSPAVGDQPEEPSEPAPVGLFMTKGQVLLAFDESDQSWQRIAPQYSILSGDRLLSLPTFHPIIGLAPGFSVGLFDGTELRLASEDAEQPPTVDLEYGRLIISTTGAKPLDCQLRLGELVATLRIQPQAYLAIEADRQFKPGVDPLVEPGPLRAMLITPTGGVAWSTPSGEFEVEEPSVWRVIGPLVAAPETIAAPDDVTGDVDATVLALAPWIAEEHVSEIDREASDRLEQEILADGPVWEYLEPQLEARRSEDRALAADCSAYVGRFEPLIRSLNDENLRRFWPKAIETMRATMARSPDSARRLRDALISEQDRERGADFYEMLVGYTDEQIGTTLEEQQAGVIPILLNRMLDARLAYRVLAHYNLAQITSRVNIYFPTASEKNRATAVSKFRGRLAEGTLIPQPRP